MVQATVVEGLVVAEVVGLVQDAVAQATTPTWGDHNHQTQAVGHHGAVMVLVHVVVGVVGPAAVPAVVIVVGLVVIVKVAVVVLVRMAVVAVLQVSGSAVPPVLVQAAVVVVVFCLAARMTRNAGGKILGCTDCGPRDRDRNVQMARQRRPLRVPEFRGNGTVAGSHTWAVQIANSPLPGPLARRLPYRDATGL